MVFEKLEFFPNGWRSELLEIMDKLPFFGNRSSFRKALDDSNPAKHLCLVGEMYLLGKAREKKSNPYWADHVRELKSRYVKSKLRETARLFFLQASALGSRRACVNLANCFSAEELSKTFVDYPEWGAWFHDGSWFYLHEENEMISGDQYKMLGIEFQNGGKLKKDPYKACLCFLQSGDIDLLQASAVNNSNIQKCLLNWRIICVNHLAHGNKISRQRKSQEPIITDVMTSNWHPEIENCSSAGKYLESYLRFLSTAESDSCTDSTKAFLVEEKIAIQTWFSQKAQNYSTVVHKDYSSDIHKIGWLDSEDEVVIVRNLIQD